MWAGGRENAPGKLTASLRRAGTTIEWAVVAGMERPIKTITSIVRGVPRGQVSFGGGGFTDLRDGESLTGYPFGGGDLNSSGSMGTPLLMIQASPTEIVYVSSLDDRVRRAFYLAGRDVIAWSAFTSDAWRNDKRADARRSASAKRRQAMGGRASRSISSARTLSNWDTRTDVPAWIGESRWSPRSGQHYTSFIFNTPPATEILRWMATQIPPNACWRSRGVGRPPAGLSLTNRRTAWAASTSALVAGASSASRSCRCTAPIPRIGICRCGRPSPTAPRRSTATPTIDWVDWNNDRHGRLAPS